MENRDIQIRGAREHNLRGVDLDIPRERFVVITGPSGSGKSSLARDTLYAEGHRRYVECLSSEARQYLQQIRKPAVDGIEGLPPAVYIDQRPSGRNPRSTVGTTTEILDYLRLLFAKAGTPHCTGCGKPIRARSLEQMADRLLELPEGSRVMVLAPFLLQGRGSLKSSLKELERQGFLRVRVDGGVREIGEMAGERNPGRPAPDLEVVVDRLVMRPGIRSRLNDSIETAARLSGGLVTAWVDPETERQQEWTFSEQAVCRGCGLSFPEISPRLFSFNSPHGACPACGGLGKLRRVDAARVVPDPGLSLADGAVHPWRKRGTVHTRQVLESLSRHLGFSLNTPFGKLPGPVRKKLLFGTGKEKIPFRFTGEEPRGREILRPYEGVVPNLERRYRETASDRVRREILPYLSDQVCPDCGGFRLRPEALAVRVRDCHIGELASRSIRDLRAWFQALELSDFHREVLEQVLSQVRRRLDFLTKLGLDYLCLDREVAGLSGGEAQRIQLSIHIASGLVGVLYILDEPTLGLHPHDTGRLLDLLEKLRDRGNSVLVVEHDEQTIRAADTVIDMGPGAGTAGGKLVYIGAPGALERDPDSVTGRFLSGERMIPVHGSRVRPDHGFLRARGARVHNLKGVNARFPIGLLTCVTGVSGSGKSSLVLDALFPALTRRIAGGRPGAAVDGAGHGLPDLEGVEFFDRVIPVDQAPLSRSPRSNPATYIGLFSLLRDLFAQLPESRRRGYGPARFSFNVKGGRCEVCRGEGLRKVEMHFLPDVFVTCDLCGGSRYNRETLEVRYRGRSIAEVLEMTVAEACAFFDPVPQIARKLRILEEVGLGYMQLGQPANTLSGGEAQRVKLARELARWATGRTLYILDEPTTGLHFVDIEKLLRVLGRLTDAGNTVVVIEHNLEVIKTADWVVDLGPGAGDAGGRTVAEGPPEKVASHPGSVTGQYLKPLMDRARSDS